MKSTINTAYRQRVLIKKFKEIRQIYGKDEGHWIEYVYNAFQNKVGKNIRKYPKLKIMSFGFKLF